MDAIRRWTIAITVFFMVFGASMVAAGTAPTDTPRDSPALWQTAPSQPGDRGLYRIALVVVSGGEGEYHDMGAQYAFERLPDRLMLDDVGALQPTSSFIGEWRTEPYELDLDRILDIPTLAMPPTPSLNFPNCWPAPPSNPEDEDAWADYEDAMDDCSDQWDDAGDQYDDEWDDWEDEFEVRNEAFQASISAWQHALDRDTHIVIASDWHVTHHDGNDTLATTYREDAQIIADVDITTSGVLGLGGSRSTPAIESQRLTFTTPLDVPGPCGWKTSLQEGPQDMWEPIQVHGECPADMFLGFADIDHIAGPIDMVVSGEDTIDGHTTVVFSTPEDADRLRLWFRDDTPYPARILTRTTSVPEPIAQSLGGGYTAPRFYVLHELVGFEAGTPGANLTSQAAPPLSGPAGNLGPDPTGFDHPWPLPEAHADAVDHLSECDEFQDWLEDRQARIVSADYTIIETEDPDHDDPIIDEAWHTTYGDGAEGFTMMIVRHTETQADTGLPTGPVRVPQVTCQDMAAGTLQNPIVGTPPSQMPSVAQAAALHASWTGAETTTYGYQLAEGHHFVTVGVTPVSPGDATAVDLLTVDEDGGLAQHAQKDSGYPEPIFEDDGWSPKADGSWRRDIATTGAWQMPRPATAATLFGLSAAVGSLALLAPALKGLLGSLGLFSRIRKEDLLEHPVRGDIMEAISSDPGIHFQEIVRRLGKGRGTMEHHIRKMVAAELLVEKAEKGFTCYFPKGQLDRHLMAAAPLLKAEGARSVMQSIVGQPGAVSSDIAERLGIANSTVNYHVKKLVQAGLVDASRQGRFVTLRSTQLGDQAFGQFGRT